MHVLTCFNRMGLESENTPMGMGHSGGLELELECGVGHCVESENTPQKWTNQS